MPFEEEEEEEKINKGIALDIDNPEWDDAMFSRAVRGLPNQLNKTRLTIRLDKDVVIWFKAKGSGYQSRINQALRDYIDGKIKDR